MIIVKDDNRTVNIQTDEKTAEAMMMPKLGNTYCEYDTQNMMQPGSHVMTIKQSNFEKEEVEWSHSMHN